MTASATTPAPAGRSHSADGQVLGVLLIASGVGWLLQRSGLVDLSWETLLSALLVMLGLGMLLTARRPGGIGLVLVGGAITIALASASSIDIGLLKAGVGERTLHPGTITAARKDARLAVGHLDVDLTDLVLSDDGGDPETIRYEVGIGELTVRVPEDADVRVVGKARGGELSLLGFERSGPDMEHEVLDRADTGDSLEPVEPDLVLHVSVWFGSVRVDRASG
ncbi:MAG TPA: hypothetical protein VF230_04100 [Acidimicrobiales bacterium]